MPLWLIYTAAELCELYSKITGSISPLTRDFIDIGQGVLLRRHGADEDKICCPF